MPGRGAGSWRGGLRARGGNNPRLPWCSSIRPHLLLRSDALLVSLSPGWVVEVLEGLVPSCDSSGTANLGAEQSFCKATASLPMPAATAGHMEGPCPCPSLDSCSRGEVGRRGEEFQLRRPRSTAYLETSSFDTSIKLIVLPAPAPEAVGHAVALK